MRTWESLINWRLRWTSTRLIVSAGEGDMLSGPLEEDWLSQRLRHTCSGTVRSPGASTPGGERLELPRHDGITAAADTIADRERHRGLHLVPDDMLLAPGTDDLERGKDSACGPAWLGFIRRMRLVVHRCSPIPLVNASTTPPRSHLGSTGPRRLRTLANCLLAERRSARRRERDVCPGRLDQDQLGSVLESRTVRVRERHTITAEDLASRENL